MMKIELLKELDKIKNKKISSSKIKGVSALEIQKVETKFNIKFPKAYKEFLYLAGDDRGSLPMMDTADIETISSDWHQEMMWEELEETATTIDKPFWLFAESNDCEQFFYFYLEESENPYVYLVDYDNHDENKKRIVPLERTFSEFIEDMIELAYRYEKKGY